jgi:hypothetical protein
MLGLRADRTHARATAKENLARDCTTFNLDRRVANGTRTRDHRDHNPGLYQLSYRHRETATA